MRDAAGRTGGAGVLVREVAKPVAVRVAQNFVERGVFVGPGSEVAVAPSNGSFVPIADAGGISVGKIGRAVSSELHERRGVVHYGRTIDRACRVVVHQAERVADF